MNKDGTVMNFLSALWNTTVHVFCCCCFENDHDFFELATELFCYTNKPHLINWYLYVHTLIHLQNSTKSIYVCIYVCDTCIYLVFVGAHSISVVQFVKIDWIILIFVIFYVFQVAFEMPNDPHLCSSCTQLMNTSFMCIWGKVLVFLFVNIDIIL